MLPETIIISRTDSIGDVVLTLPMAGVLRKKFPSCKIIFLGRSYTRAVVESCVHVDEFVNWDELKQKAGSVQLNYFRSLGVDAIVHVFPQKDIARLARKAGIPLRIGTSHRLYHWTTCNARVNLGRKNSSLHETQLNLKLLQPLGITGKFSLDELPSFYGLTRVKPLPGNLQSLIDRNKFNLILHPRSKGSAREWGLDNFSALISLLPPDRYKIFITGTEEEGESMSDFLNKNKQAVDLTGKLSLGELVSFINGCDGLVAASTGPLHIAAATGKRAIGIFAPMRPIHPGRWAPLGSRATFLVLDKNCSDCRKNGQCHCIKEITPLQVMQRLG